MKSLTTNNTFVNENNAKMNRVTAVEENNRLLRELAAVGIKARHNTWLLDGTEIR